jgi:hypothetical protein
MLGSVRGAGSNARPYRESLAAISECGWIGHQSHCDNADPRTAGRLVALAPAAVSTWGRTTI